MTEAHVLQKHTVQRWALVLLLAWLPSISFFGHWSALAAPLGIAPSAVVAHDHGEHSTHCHVEVGSCSGEGAAGAPVMAGVLAVLRTPAPAYLRSTPSMDVEPSEWTALPVTPPPRAA